MTRYMRAYRDFSGGLSEAANDNMQDNQLAEAQNIVAGDGYGIARASGYDIAYPAISGGEDVLTLLEAELGASEETTEVALLAFTATRLLRYTPPQEEGAAGSWSEVASGLAPIRDYFIHGKKLYWLDGTEFRVYDGAAVAAVTKGEGLSDAFWQRIKTASFVEQRGSRWFFARAGYDDIYYTNVGTVNGFAETNVLNANSKNADHITGLCEFNRGLLIFKERSVFYFSGWDFAGGSDLAMAELSVTSGTRFGRTVCKVENAVLYLGYNGIYRLYVPNLSTVIASRNMAEEKLSDTLYAFEPSDAFAETWNGVYYFWITNESETREYRYDISQQSFWGPFTQELSCYSTALRDANLYLGCPNGYVLVANAGSFHYIDVEDGSETAIPIRAVTKGFDVADAMVQDVKLKRLEVVARQYKEESSVVDVRVQADYNNAAFNIDFDESMVYGEGEYGATTWGWKETVTKEARVNQKAKRVRFYFTDANIDYPLLIYGVGLIYKKKKAKGNRDGVTAIAVSYDD